MQSWDVLYYRSDGQELYKDYYWWVTGECDNQQSKGLCCFVLPLIVFYLLLPGRMMFTHGPVQSPCLAVEDYVEYSGQYAAWDQYYSEWYIRSNGANSELCAVLMVEACWKSSVEIICSIYVEQWGNGARQQDHPWEEKQYFQHSFGVPSITEWQKHAAESVNGQHSQSHPPFGYHQVCDKAKELASSVSQGPATSGWGCENIYSKSQTEYEICHENAYTEHEAFVHKMAEFDESHNEQQIKGHTYYNNGHTNASLDNGVSWMDVLKETGAIRVISIVLYML